MKWFTRLYATQCFTVHFIYYKKCVPQLEHFTVVIYMYIMNVPKMLYICNTMHFFVFNFFYTLVNLTIKLT